VVLLLGKMISKCIGVYPATKVFRAPTQEAIYTTLLMSTGLTFGTISALFGLSHGVITQAQYSAVVAAVEPAVSSTSTEVAAKEILKLYPFVMT
jgi:glutathione-regulated potassium-efflux system ancillary protein KefC